MSLDVHLCVEGLTVVFSIHRQRKGYVYFDLDFRFAIDNVAFPCVRNGSMSNSDIERLIEYSDSALDVERRVRGYPFAAYDAPFTLEFLEDDTLRLMIRYEQGGSIRLGVESSMSVESLQKFRNGWARYLPP